MTAPTRVMVAVVAIAAAATTLGVTARALAAPQVVTLHVEHSRFDAGTLTVEAGRPVRFEIVNDDPIEHELIVGDREMHDLHERGLPHHHDGDDGAVTVSANSTASMTMTVPEAAELLFGCHLPGHWDYGMRGTLLVTG